MVADQDFEHTRGEVADAELPRDRARDLQLRLRVEAGVGVELLEVARAGAGPRELVAHRGRGLRRLGDVHDGARVRPCEAADHPFTSATSRTLSLKIFF